MKIVYCNRNSEETNTQPLPLPPFSPGHVVVGVLSASPILPCSAPVTHKWPNTRRVFRSERQPPTFPNGLLSTPTRHPVVGDVFRFIRGNSWALWFWSGSAFYEWRTRNQFVFPSFLQTFVFGSAIRFFPLLPPDFGTWNIASTTNQLTITFRLYFDSLPQGGQEIEVLVKQSSASSCTWRLVATKAGSNRKLEFQLNFLENGLSNKVTATIPLGNETLTPLF
jgi:hypothetical protein